MSDALPILYRDAHLVAINKPSGLLVHRSFLDRHETRFALQLLRNQLQQPVFPVHRLDKPTSGVLLFALSSDVARKTCELFMQQQVTKTYLALVRGHAPEYCRIDHPLREEDDRNPQAQRDKPAQPAITDIERLACVELPVAVDRYPHSRYSLVRCQPLTGRRHQIRRHLKHISHPIIGDAKHGKGQHNRFFQQAYGVHRLLLAATEFRMPHPVTGEPLHLQAALDEPFRRLLIEFGWYNVVPSTWLTPTDDKAYAAG